MGATPLRARFENRALLSASVERDMASERTSVPLDELPEHVRAACVRLRDGLLGLLGGDLVALWVYGAVVFPDRPKRLGDVDTHAVLARPTRLGDSIDRLHESIADDAEIEWDSWYILESDARGPDAPPHMFRSEVTDDAWPLHRAHWLAGRYVALHGRKPAEVVPAPAWPEIREGLDDALEYNEEILREGKQDDPKYAAFAVWNACRVVYSMEFRDAAISKRTAARWGLEHLAPWWRVALRAAERIYDDEAEAGDADILRSSMADIVRDSRARFESRS